LPLAHALAQKEDLPIPEWLFAWAASLVLVASFYALSVAWKTARFEDERWRPLGGGVLRALLHPATQALYGLVGVFLLGLTIYSGLEGTVAPDRNFSLTFVFVTCWLGFPLLGVLFGDVFRVFNPWRAIGRAAGSAFRRLVGQGPVHAPYPERLGRWPAAVGVVAFVWLEVIYGASGAVSVGLDPETTARATIAYTAYTLAMMVVFGTERWCDRGETFSVYFGMFGRIGSFAAREGRLGVRRMLAGTTGWAAVPGSAAVVVASIGSTAYDGAAEGPLRQPIENVFEWLVDQDVGLVASRRLAETLFLLVAIAAIAATYLAGVWGMRTVRGAPPFRDLIRAFAPSLIPIAFAYLAAHYFSLFAFQEQAQFTYLLSDPLGEGSDLFGTASGGIDYGALGANAIWYFQVAALVVGHVAGLVLAHDRAVALWGDPKQAARSQYWMLAVMVGFTCLGLYLLSAANQ
ncbi:MAG TPA: fenitrothion hydrolase, partial [Solirubrobacterales bacterium]|nr:fenitrothion hydrolase [Solirubrobacterales bacterium]